MRWYAIKQNDKNEIKWNRSDGNGEQTEFDLYDRIRWQHTHTHTHTHTRMYIHTHTHTHEHIYIHARVRKQEQLTVEYNWIKLISYSSTRTQQTK